MSPPPHRLLLALLAVLLLLLSGLPLLLASSSFPLPTIAIAAAVDGSNGTAAAASTPHHLACGLVAAGTGYRISCASVSNRSDGAHVYSYGGDGTSSPFSAVVAGDGYVCLAGPTSSPPMSMRWWDLDDGHAPSKRVYRGPALSAVSGGGEYVCGLVEQRMQCWRFPFGDLPDGVGFSAVAVSRGFVCGLVVGTGEVRCYGEGEAVGREPRGKYMLLAAGERHACGVDDGGMVRCWGEAAAVAAAAPPRVSRAVSAVAVGDAITCALWGNWTVSCWPEEEVAPPPAAAQQQFVALEAKGKVVCGVLMSDYSLLCWGGGVTGGMRKVFDKVLPGPCAPSASCSCGVWSGSAPLCGGSGGNVAVCYPCGYSPPPMALTPTSNSSSSTSPSKGKRRPSNLVIALISAGAGSGLVALFAALVAVHYLRRHRGSSSPVSGRIHAEPTSSAPRVERRLSALLDKGPNTTVEQFPLVVLRAVTDGFSPPHRIGSGSFGAVYHASLADGREVAIKRAERRDTGGPSSSAAAARRIDHEAAFKYEGSGTPKNVVDIAVPHIELDRVHRMLDARLPLPTPGEMEAVAYVGYLAADCVRLSGRDRPTMSEVVGVLERAVAACDEYEEGGEPDLSRSCTDGSTAT
ncbi:hypothetical protein ABZP36_007263 [Zizania latifolia]